MADRLVRTLLVLAALTASTHAFASDVLEVLVLGKDVVSKVVDSWYDISELSNVTSGLPVPIPKRKEEIIMSRLDQISKQINKVERGIEKVGAMAFYVSKNLGRGTRLELRLHEMTDLLNRVSSADRVMREYVGLQRELEKTTLLDFAEWCVSHDQGALPGLLERIHSLLVPPHKHLLGQSLLQLLLERFQRQSLERPLSLRSGSPLYASVSAQRSVFLAPRHNPYRFGRDTMIFAALIALFAIASATELSPVDDVRAKFYVLERELWKNVTDPEWRVSGLGGDVELTKAFVQFDDQVQSIPIVPRPHVDSWIWAKASEKMQVVNGLYKSFIEFVRRQATPGVVPAPSREWLDLAEAVLMDPKSSVSHAVRKLDELLEHGDRVLYYKVQEAESLEACTTPMSPHQVIYDIYNTVALTEIKGYAMMQFSWMLLRIYDKGNFTQEASLTRHRYTERTAQAAAVAKSALNEASRDLYMCDPPLHVEGETYDQVTRLLQGYVENEVDMNTDGTCKENCAHYTLAQKHGCYMDQFCAKQKPCNGRIIDCQYLDSDMWVCPANRNSHRRYEWIEYENGRKLGKVGSCSRGSTKVDSWWRWLFWHCSYCMCLCDDPTNSDRHFSLWDATSDVNNNKVVTGVRLVKHGRVFHLQVYEGTLKGRGFVEPSGWVPIKKFDPSDPEMMDGVDYHTLTYEKRAIDLDELDSPEGYVLTGIRFRMIGAHLHFEIRSTPFNYTTGRLQPNRSQWISNDNTDAAQNQPRSKLELKKPDIPTRSHTKLQLDSHHDQYLEFTHSDFDADAAQSTVPFIDVQPVLPNKGAALATGAGVIHRGADNSGGFIALKLTSYSYARHVKAEPPPTGFTEEKEDATDIVMAIAN